MSFILLTDYNSFTYLVITNNFFPFFIFINVFICLYFGMVYLSRQYNLDAWLYSVLFQVFNPFNTYKLHIATKMLAINDYFYNIRCVY